MSLRSLVAPERRLYPHVVVERLPPEAPRKIACVTLDFECDYGSRTGRFGVARHGEELSALRGFFLRARIPLSVFVVTEMLDRWPEAAPLARSLGDDWHSHSHTHGAPGADLAAELASTVEGFRRHFGRRPAGYRAPMGRLRPEDVPLLAAAGFSFSASIFPAYRPGVYNHLGQPILPLRYENGLVELPFGVVRGVRLPVAVSYFKLLGTTFGPPLLGLLGVPDVLVVNFHLHDVIVDEESLARVSRGVRAVYQVRKHEGLDVLAALTRRLGALGYTFLTMTELAGIVARAP